MIIRALNQTVDTGSQAGQQTLAAEPEKASKLHALHYLFNAQQLMSGFLHNDLPLLSP
jgi:hypothetical protein